MDMPWMIRRDELVCIEDRVLVSTIKFGIGFETAVFREKGDGSGFDMVKAITYEITENIDDAVKMHESICSKYNV